MKTVREIYRRETRVNSHSEISLLVQGMPQLHMWQVKVKRMELWEGHLMEGLDWNNGMMENDKRREE